MTTKGIFDFLRGDRTISVSTAEIELEENLKDLKNETWTLYTLNPESKECPLDCLIIVVHARKLYFIFFFKILNRIISNYSTLNLPGIKLS